MAAVNHSYCPDNACDNNECFDIVQTSKTVTVPCQRNVREAYTVEVPRRKAITVNKQVPYTDYESRERQVPYEYVDRQTVIKNVPVCRVFPIVKNMCTNVPTKRGLFGGYGSNGCVRKKCPRTVYVKKKCCQPRQFCQSVRKTGWRTEKKNVPVTKIRNVTEIQYKTEKVPVVRYRNRPVTKMVTKTVPVFNVVQKQQAAAMSANNALTVNSGLAVNNTMLANNALATNDTLVTTIRAPEERTVLPPITILPAAHPAVTFDLADSNRDGRISRGEYAAAGYAAGGFAAGGFAARGRDLGPYAGRSGQVYRDFRRIDKNRDGMLSYPEVAYDMADTNKDGVLDFNEYSKGVGAQAYSTGYGTGYGTQGYSIGYGAQGDFERIDKDRDGYLNPLEARFDYADTNKTGQLGFGEYAAARASGILPGNTATVLN